MLANGVNRVRPGRRLSLRQVVDLQRFSFEAAKGLSDDFQETKDKEARARVASAISNLAKGWVSLQDAKREILGKPKAGVRKHAVEKKPKRREHWSMPVPIEVEPEPAETGIEQASEPPAAAPQPIAPEPAPPAEEPSAPPAPSAHQFGSSWPSPLTQKAGPPPRMVPLPNGRLGYAPVVPKRP
jgi:hypothetical protein